MRIPGNIPHCNWQLIHNAPNWPHGDGGGFKQLDAVSVHHHSKVTLRRKVSKLLVFPPSVYVADGSWILLLV